MPEPRAEETDARRAAVRAEVAERHGRREAEADRLGRRAERLSMARLLVFAVGLVFCLWITRSHPEAWGWMVPPAVLFTALVLLHTRAKEAAEESAAARDVQARSLRRLDGDASDGPLAPDPAGPPTTGPVADLARDLDLLGRGSVFQLVATAGTRLGLTTLARWLTSTSPATETRARQAAVTELAADADLREQLAVLASREGERLDREALVAWVGQPPAPPPPWARPVAAVLAVAGVGTLTAWSVGLWPFFPLGLVILADLVLLGVASPRVSGLREGLKESTPGLATLAKLMARLEEQPFQAPRLVELQAALREGDGRGSAALARLGQLAERLAAGERNAFLVPFAILLHTPIFTVAALEGWRAAHRDLLARWLDATGELEALAALGSHAYEHPTHTMPELLDGPPRLEAEALGHPLLPLARCVTNDLTLDGERRLLLLSGSNMSGKSTLMRAVGVNVQLAMAGAPVRAARLAVTPLVLGTSLRVVDSLMDGTSHFLAEVQRLKTIDGLTRGDQPVLYLLDEILHGTNSSDRLTGSRAVITRFFERGALGLVTTHDLALTAIADELAPAAWNAHLREGFEDGRMVFDYKLREGVVSRGNALDLMRAQGLDV